MYILYGLSLVATVIYLADVLGVSATANIPLNNSLQKLNILQISKEAIAAQRIAFETSLNRLNLIRTISSSISLACVIFACIHQIKK
jgi:uncharacterized membrane protein